MTFERLGQENAEAYVAYLRTAMREEPEKMTAETVDEEGIRNRVSDPFYAGTTSILAMEDGNVVGRIEYHFYGCMQDGYRMAYVDWVYVLKAYRHRGIAQMLFAELEKDCGRNGIDQYYLIRARNEEADRFYGSFRGAAMEDAPILRRYLEAREP